jgi:hypothetical protein
MDNATQSPFSGSNNGAGSSPGGSSGGGSDGGSSRRDERAAKRFPCSGRARVTATNGVAHDGKMFDISRNGGCIMLENRIAIGATYSVRIVVFKAGKTQDFNVQAKCMHATLVGDQGFKHGFEFDHPTDLAMKSIAALTDSTGAVFN